MKRHYFAFALLPVVSLAALSLFTLQAWATCPAGDDSEYVGASSFTVTIDGVGSGPFDSASGLGVDFQDIACDQEKNHLLNRPGRFNARDIHLVRRFGKDPDLRKWLVQIKYGEPTKKSGSVIVLDDESKEIMRFNFFGASIKEWSGPTPRRGANGKQALDEKLVLRVEDVEIR
jgi:phage tail-like protein